MQEEKQIEIPFLQVRMSGSGRKGAVSGGDEEECPARFVRYEKISIPEKSGPHYLVYMYYPNNVVGHTECSFFYDHESHALNAAIKALCIPIASSQEEIDTQVYRAMQPFGKVQKIDGTERYDLVERVPAQGNFLPAMKVVSVPTQNDPLDKAHLMAAESSCVLL